MKHWYIILLFVTVAIKAQHYQFSQFYSAPTYLNPAFTGANVCSRATINYRNQWSGIPGTFTSYQASVDHELKRYHSGIGLQFFSDKAGIGNLRTTQISLLYAYEAKINNKIHCRAGINAGTMQRKVDYNALTFGDQIARNGAATSVEGFGDGGVTYFDAGIGFLAYSRTAWLGFAANHINQANQSLMNGESILPTELKFHGGYKIVLEESETTRTVPDLHSITIGYNYKKQQKFNQVDLGIYYAKNFLVLGCWYRGIPLFKPENSYQNNDAIIFLTGITIDKYKIGYSYDYTLSTINNVNTRGTHELSMSYQLCKFKKGKTKKNDLISCPKF